MARRSSEDEVSVFDDHPLFPVEEGESPLPIFAIHVTRYDRGAQIWADRVFRADELQDLSQIAALYGGGQYELIGRKCSKSDPSKLGNIVARRKYRIGGASLPISDRTDENVVAGVVGAQAPPAQQASGLGDNQVLLALLQMSQQQQQAAQVAQQQASQQFMQLMMTSMQQSKSESTALVTMMMQMGQQQQQSMVSMMSAMMSNRGGGPEEMAKYAELLKTLGFGKGGEEEEKEELNIPKLLEDAADTVQGLVQLGGIRSSEGGGAPSVPAPPGSAASVVRGGEKG